MTKGDHEARERDQQMGRLGLPMFHVEQPGVLVFYDGRSACEPQAYEMAACGQGQSDMIQGLEAKDLSEALAALREAELAAAHEAAAAHARSMGEAHQQRMLKLQAEAHACVGMQRGDSGWRDWNDG
jgi:hypothetical protein